MCGVVGGGGGRDLKYRPFKLCSPRVGLWAEGGGAGGGRGGGIIMLGLSVIYWTNLVEMS